MRIRIVSTGSTGAVERVVADADIELVWRSSLWWEHSEAELLVAAVPSAIASGEQYRVEISAEELAMIGAAAEYQLPDQ